MKRARDDSPAAGPAREGAGHDRRLAEAERQLNLIQSVVDRGFSAVLITDGGLPDPVILYVNPSFARATGCSAQQVVGRNLSSLAGLANVQKRLPSGLPKGDYFMEEISTFQTSEGERWGEWRVGPVPDESGRDTHWLFIFRDITERKRLEKEVLEISDQERHRLGQDLHDGLCQHLAGIELMSQVLEQKLLRESKADAARAAEIARHVRDAIAQTRALARGLSPVTLELDGLLSALCELAANTEKMFGVRCRVEQPEVVPPLTIAVATHLYRIAQEAVSNAIRHGKAKSVVIRLEFLQEMTVLSVIDDGAGLRQGATAQDGMGLRIMQYRASMIGGNLRVSPYPSGGVIVVCSVPGPHAQMGT
jgi:PAS domain S-box-containing protein